jgi:negative regulator of sigma E activity
MTDQFDPPPGLPASPPTEHIAAEPATEHIAAEPATEHIAGEELSALVDGELGGDRAAVVLEHLASCQACERDRHALAETRRLLGQLPTTVDAAARASAVAAALAVVGTAAVGTAAVGADRPASNVVTMQRHRRRYRAVAIAASVLLACGVAGGIDVLHHSLGSSSSMSVARPRGQQSASGGVTSTTTVSQTIEFRALETSNALGPVLDVLGPGSATKVRLSAGKAGRFTALVVLAPSHPVPAALRAARQIVVLALPAGTRLGLLDRAGSGTIQIGELTERAALEVRRLLS